MNLVGNHESGIEAQSEMTDNLVFICFVLVFLQEIRCTGEGNLVNIFLYFVGSHTKTVVSKGESFFFRIYHNLDLRLVILWKCGFAHHL